KRTNKLIGFRMLNRMKLYVKAKSYLLEDGEKEGGYIRIHHGCFTKFTDTIPTGAEVIDYENAIIDRGLIDSHIHDVNGYDIMDGNVDALKGISETILPLGITRFLPTTLTSSKEDLDVAIQKVKQAVEEGLPGAQSAGIFLEGPFFTEKYKGAQNPEYFLD